MQKQNVLFFQDMFNSTKYFHQGLRCRQCQLITYSHIFHTYNRTKKEHEALLLLKNNDELIIKPDDRGWVIWSRQKYTTEAHRPLDNANFYVQMMSNPLDKLKQELKDLLLRAKTNNWIDNKEYEYLCPSEPCLATFYVTQRA